MDFTNFWFPKKAGAGGDPGDPIDQSLRVYDDRRIRKSNADWTTDFSASGVISIWYKFGMWFNDSQSDITWVAANIGVSGADRGMGHRGDTGAITVRGTTGTVTVPGLYRDPGAWYHIVMSCDGTHQRVWINGELKLTTTSIWAAGPAAFDSDTWAWTSPTYSPGAYMAAVYFIDGQALGPETFGRYNDYGVWVPVRPEGLTFGSNGFYLDFSDPDDLGADRSGNGNDFTAVGFNTQLPGVWSQQLFTSTKSAIDFTSTNTAFAGGAGPEFAFDGVDNFATNPAATSDTSLIFRPNVPLANVTEIRVNNGGPTGNAGNENGFNGANVTPVAADGGWMTLYSGPPITVNNIFTQSDNRCFIGGISINGQVLVDNTGEDYDLMADSPTQNYPTINPLNVTGPAFNPNTLDANLQANLTISQADWASTSSMEIRNNIYFEATYTSFCSIGIAESNVNNNSRVLMVCQDGNAFRQDNFGTDGPTNLLTSQASGTVGVRVNPTARTVAWTFDGTTYSNDYSYPAVENPIVPYLSAGVAQPSNTDLYVNYGQRPFLFDVPNGFNRLQTQNLPEATIANGRDHFQAITGPGSGGGSTDPDAILGAFSSTWSASGDGFGTRPPANAFDDNTTNFLNNSAGGQTITWDTSSFNLVGELTVRQQGSGGFYRMLIDGVEAVSSIPDASEPSNWTVTVNNPQSIVWDPSPGNGSGVNIYNFQLNGDNLRDGNILAIAQQTFTNGLWWIKDRANSNRWQLACSEYDVAPTDNVVISGGASGYNAYTPPAGDSVAYCWDLTDPTVSGIEFISDTGTGVQRTVSHNLGRVPQMIWAYNMVIPSSNNVWVYHSAYGPNGAFNLHNTGAPDARTIFWGGVNPTDTEFTVGAAGSTNPVGAVYYWVFAEVPGFSAYGRYNGNATTDNSFVFTPFRPAFVMIKSIAAGGNWQIYDTTRSPNNPARHFLSPNNNLAETTGFDIDILSNGFKVRSNNGPNAAATGAVWCAFAENPFSSPTPAR